MIAIIGLDKKLAEALAGDIDRLRLPNSLLRSLHGYGIDSIAQLYYGQIPKKRSRLSAPIRRIQGIGEKGAYIIEGELIRYLHEKGVDIVYDTD